MSRGPRNKVPTVAITVAMPAPYLEGLRRAAVRDFVDAGKYGHVLRAAVLRELQRRGLAEADPQLPLKAATLCPPIGGAR